MNNPPTTTTPARRLLAVAVAGLVLATGACSAGSDKRAETQSAAGSTSRPAAGATTVREDSGSTKTTAPADDKVIATATGQRKAAPNDATMVPLRLDVTSVKRLSGDTVEVRFNLTNTGDVTTYEPYRTLSDQSLVGGGEYDIGGVALLDRPNDKKYLTLYDTEKTCLCSNLAGVSLQPGKTIALYADVTAPPKSTSTVDLSLPGFSPIVGLEIR